jgi:hypothetical protein
MERWITLEPVLSKSAQGFVFSLPFLKWLGMNAIEFRTIATQNKHRTEEPVSLA